MAEKETETPTNPEKEMSLLSHLDELRVRLIISVVALIVFTSISFFWAQDVLEILTLPTKGVKPRVVATVTDPDVAVVFVDPADGTLRVDVEAIQKLNRMEAMIFQLSSSDEDGETSKTLALETGTDLPSLIYLSPMDPFLMPLRVALIMGILLSLVVWVWQIWLFVKPGLTDKESRVVRPLLVGAIVLFPIGASFAYGMFYFIIPLMESWAVSNIETQYNIRDYIKLMTNMMIVFGFIFELPMVIAMLARIGIVTPAFLTHYRRHIYVGLAVLAMLITPADPWTMLMALIPLVVLFEVSVWIAKAMALMRKRDIDEGSGEGDAA